MQRYNPQTIEPKWQTVWEKTGIYTTPKTPKNKYYCLVMFPYSSGDLHIGHWYNFGPGDTVARFNRMQGKDVLHPIGFDAFGLPAENAAIKNKIPPAKWTWSNINNMTKQLHKIGTMYDWDKTVETCNPDYYRWTQWLFLKLYEHGLAERKRSIVNWCPKDQTVLANEQVIGDDNRCERCETPVVQKELEQWFLKITDYADQLLEDLDKLNWPTKVKTMQTNWIGKSVGAEIDFKLANSKDVIRVFTTRADTLFGATYLVMAPEHSLVGSITSASQKIKVDSYIAKTANKTELDRKETEKDKTGVFTGAYAINPVNNAKIPIWIADYVLMSYGTGAIMAVPAHDERDWEFAKKHEIPITEVIYSKESSIPYTGEGKLINSSKYDGLDSFTARDEIVVDLGKRHLAKEKVNYKLRDWLISRQRYWGTPIPIVYCDNCGIKPVPYNQLPVELPEDVSIEMTGKSPLLKIDSFVNTKCPKCHRPAKRETDTMDTFVDSSWYYLRYPNNKYKDGPFDPEAVKTWLPVDHYMGGVEHAILHLLYSRFITKFLHDYAGLTFNEPFKRLTNQGMILGPDGNKMSKSKGNVVNPDDQVSSYGTDSLRLYLMFMGPYDQGGAYDLGGIAGTRRFIERVWRLVEQYVESTELGKMSDIDNQAELETKLLSSLNKSIKKVTLDLQKTSFNTAISSMMEFVNSANKMVEQLPMNANSNIWREVINQFLQLLAPFAPHVTEELWSILGHDSSIHLSDWPLWDDKLLAEEMINIVVQINGKLRANLQVNPDMDMDEIVKIAQDEPNVVKYIGLKKIKKTIKVPNRLVNFVV